jgi:hypothetical protein
LFTGELLAGLDGDLFSLYPVRDPVRGMPLETSDDPLLNGMWPNTLLVKASDLNEIISAGVASGGPVWQRLVQAHLDSLAIDARTSKRNAS